MNRAAVVEGVPLHAAQSNGIRRAAMTGALHGLVAWLVYGVVEFIFYGLWCLVRRSNAVLGTGYWHSTGILMGAYAAAGLICGALSGPLVLALARRRGVDADAAGGQRFESLATLTFVAALAIKLLLSPPPLRAEDLACLLLAACLGTGLLASVASDVWLKRMSAFTSPWLSSILLLGVLWIGGQIIHRSSVPMRILATALFTAACLGGAILGSWLPQIGRRAGRHGLLKQATVVAGVAILCLGCSVAFNRRLRLEPLQNRVWEKDRPNVLLVTLDTVRADHLSVYGYSRETTPHLKDFAKEATLYTSAIATSDMTFGAHASIFTGMYASWHGAHYAPPARPAGWPLDSRYPTLADVLSSKGYETFGEVANAVYLDLPFGLARGFQHYRADVPVPLIDHHLVPVLLPNQPRYLRDTARKMLGLFTSTPEFDIRYRGGAEINQDVFRILRQIKENQRPFFLFVNYMDAHVPYLPPPPYDRQFGSTDSTLTYAGYRRLETDVLNRSRQVSAEEQRRLISQYDGGIAYLDSQIGELLRRIKDLGLYDNTMVVITADHGEDFGRRDLLEHGTSVYQEQIHVPLLLKYPRRREARVVEDRVSQVDLMPTILKALGYDVPAGIQGQILAERAGESTRVLYSESFPRLAYGNRLARTERALFSGPLKLILSSAGKRELYNLLTDPAEEHNLYSEQSAVCQQLRVQLEQWIRAIPAPRKTPPRSKSGLDQLRSLGYVQ
jgi:arylsulfatase A-like enzyme